MRSKLALVIVTVAIVVLVIYGEFVLDIRTPRSPLAEIHAITSSVSILTADYNRAVDTMKKKYGLATQTSIESQPARLVVRVGGKVVEEDRTFGDFSDARGLFAVGPRGHVESIFPFQIDPREPPKPSYRREPSVQYLKSRFGGKLPGQYLAFDDRDAETGACTTMTTADLGLLGRLLRLQSGTFCVVSWKGASPSSMLVGVTLGNGEAWMRPFSPRVCRWLTMAALARMAATDGKPPADYAACLLVDGRSRLGAAGPFQPLVYEVHRDATLSYVK